MKGVTPPIVQTLLICNLFDELQIRLYSRELGVLS